MAAGPLGKDVLGEYERNGYVVAKRMFNQQEIELLRRAAKEDRDLDQHSFGKGDGEGGVVRLSLWNHPGDTIYGMFASCETRENGCMQVLKGSHRLGRIDHVLTGDQAGADMERVREAEKRLELVHVEMDPGDVLFFHANLLHRSDQNRSDKPRWAMICCYNAARNDPYKEAHHPRYTPLSKVPDSAILDAGTRRFSDTTSNVPWLDVAKDESASSLAKH